MRMKINLALDSGAHSIHMRNKKQQRSSEEKFIHTDEFLRYLDGYIGWCKTNARRLMFFVTLDLIHDEEATWEVTKVLLDEGLTAMPVLHYGAPPESIDRYLDAHEFLGISIGGGIPPTVEYYRWAQQVFKRIGRGHKAHGFASTAYDLMSLPWYSVDSTTPWFRSRTGDVMIPTPIFKRGKVSGYSYTKPNYFAVTEGTAQRRMHFTQHSTLFQKAVLDYLETTGFSLEELAKHYHCRDVVNMLYMDRMFKDTSIRYFVSGRPGTQIKNIPWVLNTLSTKGVRELNYLGTYFDLDPFDIVLKVKEGSLKPSEVQTSEVRDYNKRDSSIPFERDTHDTSTKSNQPGRERAAHQRLHTDTDAPVLRTKARLRIQ